MKGFLRLLILLFATWTAGAQTYPVSVTPQVKQPAPIYLSSYADASTINSPLQVQLLLNDLSVANREIRLKTYFEGNGLSFESNSIVSGAPQLFLEGGIPLVLTNAELAPYFEFSNINGISAVDYGRAIPEGLYNFCFEVYDAVSGNRLSQKSCATAYIYQNEPPFIIAPQNKSSLEERNPQNIVFQWTPRHINVTNVEYELSLVEIWDNYVDPQAAFMASPPVFQTTTRSTTYVYGPSDPLLLPNKRYAWRVQAKAMQGTEGIGLFKNNGYSEIFWFNHTAPCDTPQNVSHEVKGMREANIYWDDASTEISEYTVRYRERGEGNQWFTSRSTANWVTLWDLRPGTVYEYQIAKKCELVNSEYSPVKTLTTFIADDEAGLYNCGIPPAIDISSQQPLENLQKGDVFKAGDFPVKVLEVSGSNGRFTGKGYVTVPYLSSIKVAVEFTNVFVNADRQLAEGMVVTKYDPSLKNILDVDEAIDDVADAVEATGEMFEGDNDLDEIHVNFEIPPGKENEYITIEDGEIVVTNPANGATETSPLGDDKVIIDSEGNTYHVDAGGEITQGGQIAEGGAVVADNVEGVGNNGQLTSLTSEDVLVTFEDDQGSNYGFDALPDGEKDALKNEYTIIKDADGNDYVLPHKAVENGQPDNIVAHIEFKNSDYDQSDILFKTQQGVEVPAESVSSNMMRLNLKGHYTYENEIIYAVVKAKDSTQKQQTAGAFTLWHMTDREVNVELIRVNDAEIGGDVTEKVYKIFKKGVTTVNVSIAPDRFNIDPGQFGANGIDIADSPWLASYNDEQKAFISQFKNSGQTENDKYYLFVFGGDIQPSKDIAGFMPLQRQFGFVFNASAEEEGKGTLTKTIAHEIGHGVFALKHPFTEYGTKHTPWLMDYTSGDGLSHMDWAQMHNPDLKFYVFQDDEEGQYEAYEHLIGYNVVPGVFNQHDEQIDDNPISFISSAGKIITLPNNVEDITFDSGRLWAFTVYENGKKERYVSTKWTNDGSFAGYLKQVGNSKNWNDVVYRDDISRNLSEEVTVYSGILSSGDGVCGIDLYKRSFPNEADKNEWNSGGNREPMSSANYVAGLEPIVSNISSPQACDLCENGEEFYNKYAYLAETEPSREALMNTSRLVCEDPQYYEILVSQLNKDFSNKLDDVFWLSNSTEYENARDIFWEAEDAFEKYYDALVAINDKIGQYNTNLTADVEKEQLYAAIYYLNNDFIKSLSVSQKVNILNKIFEKDFFITSSFLGLSDKDDESMVMKVVNSVNENKSEATEFLDSLSQSTELFNDLSSGLDDHLDAENYTNFILKLTKLSKLAYDPGEDGEVMPLIWGAENKEFILKFTIPINDYRFDYSDGEVLVTGMCYKETQITEFGGFDVNICKIDKKPLHPFKDFAQVTIIDKAGILPVCNNNQSQFCGRAVIVPAIFLEYMQTKLNNQKLENLGFNVITIAGIVLSGGELAAARVGSAAWYWAAADLTYTFSDPIAQNFKDEVKNFVGEEAAEYIYMGWNGVELIFAAKDLNDLSKINKQDIAKTVASKTVLGEDEFYRLLRRSIKKDRPDISDADLEKLIENTKNSIGQIETELSPELLESEISKAGQKFDKFISNTWSSAIGERIEDLTEAPIGYEFYIRDGKKWIRRQNGNVGNPEYPRLTVKEGKIVRYFSEFDVAYKQGWSKSKVLSYNKGSRPNPSEYLEADYIQNHINKFNEEGGAFIVVKSWIENGAHKKFPLRKYVMLKSDMQSAILRYKHTKNINELEDALGYSRGDLSGLEEGLFVFYPKNEKYRFDIPNGNEIGANSLWEPGGKTSGDFMEAVLINEADPAEQILHDKNIETLKNQFDWDKL
ncbi:fibronectin type III domain-containing protein [Galbibacter sp. EGI 63066]|uniref:fibronectin type III domain-containing protein n=1 Tax=Galbibacter sp. EGI 63066 TaxID=2993559 RepID=UPI0022497B8F|nr:fibronectin type III domain-containing protein [Galbibacter sp. EGI 63066]MCX2680553.1 fibronectin type III domain-containing protein [Galbibacter sp. EGI 63066]